LEEECDSGFVDGFVIPFPCEAKCLASVELGELAPEVPVLLGPGELVGPAHFGLQLGRWWPPFREQIRSCPVVEEAGRTEMG
jgi:hypothetical protein